MSEHTSATAKPPKGRSPSYPSIPLNEAIDKARDVLADAYGPTFENDVEEYLGIEDDDQDDDGTADEDEDGD